jgi:Fe-S-cluster containining protein
LQKETVSMDQQRGSVIEAHALDSTEAFASEASNGTAWEALEELRDEIAGGLLYTHSRTNSNTSRVLEASSFLYALIELLKEKGILSIEELDERKTTVAERVTKRFLDKGMGVHLQEPEQDKYSVNGKVEIDCENRVYLCQAACCRMWFPLSKQDIEERVVKWDLRFPYIIAQDADHYCKHLERSTCRCSVYQHRPLPCRTFDCRKDKRIWLDFENKVVNPNLEALFQGQQPDGAGDPTMAVARDADNA